LTGEWKTTFASGVPHGVFLRGVSRQTINAIETGRYLPSLPLAIALARYFDSTVEEIFRTRT
jgi:putative transcriptional regulator